MRNIWNSLLQILMLSLIILVASCDKRMDLNDERVYMDSSPYLNFSSYEGLIEYIEQVGQMTEEERIAHESDLEFISYGSIANTYYFGFEEDSTETDSLELLESLQQHVDTHTSFLSLEQDDSGEFTYETKYVYSPYYYIMNSSRIYVVGDTAFKVFQSGLLTTLINNITELEFVNEEDLDEVLLDESFSFLGYPSGLSEQSDDYTYNEGAGPVVDRCTNGKNRTFLQISIEPIQYSKTAMCVMGIVRPYHRTLGIWFRVKRTITSDVNDILIHYVSDNGWATTRATPSIAPSSTPEYCFEWIQIVSNINSLSLNETHFAAYNCRGKTPDTGYALLQANLPLL